MIDDDIVKTIASAASLCLLDSVVFASSDKGSWVYFHSFFYRSCARILIIHSEKFSLVRRGTGFVAETVDSIVMTLWLFVVVRKRLDQIKITWQLVQYQRAHKLIEDGNAYRIELGTVGWERCWGAVTWTLVHHHLIGKYRNTLNVLITEYRLPNAQLYLPVKVKNGYLIPRATLLPRLLYSRSRLRTHTLK
jgi:hypothetical protein